MTLCKWLFAQLLSIASHAIDFYYFELKKFRILLSVKTKDAPSDECDKPIRQFYYNNNGNGFRFIRMLLVFRFDFLRFVCPRTGLFKSKFMIILLAVKLKTIGHFHFLLSIQIIILRNAMLSSFRWNLVMAVNMLK